MIVFVFVFGMTCTLTCLQALTSAAMKDISHLYKNVTFVGNSYSKQNYLFYLLPHNVLSVGILILKG
jgi:hypothetical protein